MTTIEAPASAETQPSMRSRSRVLSLLIGNKSAVVGGVVLALIALTAIIGPFVTPIDADAVDVVNKLQGPSGMHWLGTDYLGRDILSRLLEGARVTAMAAALSIVVGTLLGAPAGFLAGFLRGAFDAAASRVSEVLMSLPPLLIAFVIIGVLGPGLTNAMIAIGILMAPRFFRIARAAAMAIHHETYIESSQSAGCSTFRIMWRHVLPNANGPLIVQMSFGIGIAVIAEATLSYLGLGVQAPQSSWGGMIRDGFSQLSTTVWPIIPPAVAIAGTILAVSLVGDGLRDAYGRVVRGK
ncbi:ABC transporter permease [Rhodococcus wratislaviensis]|uniref:ABC transporter permease n=1 Tax=Rhodococcus wratislaviensis TaxID=44752 RepID=UPI00365A8AB2